MVTLSDSFVLSAFDHVKLDVLKNLQDSINKDCKHFLIQSEFKDDGTVDVTIKVFVPDDDPNKILKGHKVVKDFRAFFA